MNRLTVKLLWITALAACAGPALIAQNISGTWQGSLPNPQNRPPMRVVIKISRSEESKDESLKAVLYNIDQPSQPLNAGATTFQSSVLKMAVPAIGGNYEGTLKGDTITGTWNQGGPSVPFVLTRATPETAWAIPEPPPPPKPMAGEGNPVFEVTTIKPSNPDTPGKSILVGRGGANLFSTTNSTVQDLIVFAYGIHVRQLTNAPGWVETEAFDVTGKPDRPGMPNETQVRGMVQKMLEDRFHLSFHREKKELSAYTITVVKTGPKLTKNDTGGLLPGFGGRGPGSIGVRNSNMEQFAGFLQARILDRPVVDQTGLAGKFDFTLTWRPDQLPPQGPNAPPLPADIESRADIFTAFQEQLGLKLEATKAPVEVLVIDRVEKPTEN
jgi:uncharacterized protein (TIGR03435 family)